MKELRPYQSAAIDQLRDAIGAGYKRIVLASPTGSGKSLIAANIIERARERDKRVLITVPALSLIGQVLDVLHDEGITDVGVIQADHPCTDWSKPVQLASLQTLQRRQFPKCDIQIIDECHIMMKVIGRLLLDEDRRHIVSIGLSATPLSKGLGAFYEKLIIGNTTAALIDEGVLSPFRTFAPSHPDLAGVRTQMGEYHEADLAERMNKTKLVADIVATWKRLAVDRPTICFAVNRAHAKSLQEKFEAEGVPASYVDCETPVKEREEIQRRFEAGDVKVVCNVDIIGLGINWPSISCISYCRPTKSKIRWIQNIGRGLRVADGKFDLLVLDHSDTSLRLGFVTDIPIEELDDGKPKEATTKEMPLPKECPQCAYLKPPRTAVCPNCGHEAKHHAPPIAVAPGVLQELTPRPKGSAARFPDRRATYGQLAWYAASKNYKPGWAANKYRDLYGVWPRGMDDAMRYPPTPDLATWIRSTKIRWAKSRQPVTIEARKLRDDAIIAGVREKFMPGTLMTQNDMDEFR